MKFPYKYTVDESVFQVFANCSKRQREELLRIFSFLSRQPFTEGDTVQSDRIGRHCQVKRFGDWLIVYWPEHLAGEVHIIDAERLTRTSR